MSARSEEAQGGVVTEKLDNVDERARSAERAGHDERRRVSARVVERAQRPTARQHDGAVAAQCRRLRAATRAVSGAPAHGDDKRNSVSSVARFGDQGEVGDGGVGGRRRKADGHVCVAACGGRRERRHERATTR